MFETAMVLTVPIILWEGITQVIIYACKIVIKQIRDSIIKLCFTVKRKRSASFPMRPTAAAPIDIDCGEIILPVTPPLAFAATVTTGSTPIALAEVCCILQKKAFDEVSEPVRNTPNQPRMGEKKGKRIPVLASAVPIVVDIPELLAINAKPTTEAIVIIGSL